MKLETALLTIALGVISTAAYELYVRPWIAQQQAAKAAASFSSSPSSSNPSSVTPSSLWQYNGGALTL